MITWFVRVRDYYLSGPRSRFEVITIGLALLFGLVLMPALIYLAGHATLNAYANGGAFTLYRDFYKGLVALRPSCWTVVIGPLVFISLVRFFRLILRKL